MGAPSFLTVTADMAEAEMAIRAATFLGTPGEQLAAVMDAYFATPTEKRDAFVAVLAARVTLIHQPSSVNVEVSIGTLAGMPSPSAHVDALTDEVGRALRGDQS